MIRFRLAVDPVVHFEMPAEDRNQMADFYEQAFGWKTKKLGEDTGNYVLATTTSEVDREGPAGGYLGNLWIFPDSASMFHFLIPKVTG
jgi:predicted enzyme related to lactoylglutathione lyase